jgi:hypothetical protein
MRARNQARQRGARLERLEVDVHRLGGKPRLRGCNPGGVSSGAGRTWVRRARGVRALARKKPQRTAGAAADACIAARGACGRTFWYTICLARRRKVRKLRARRRERSTRGGQAVRREGGDQKQQQPCFSANANDRRPPRQLLACDRTTPGRTRLPTAAPARRVRPTLRRLASAGMAINPLWSPSQHKAAFAHAGAHSSNMVGRSSGRSRLRLEPQRRGACGELARSSAIMRRVGRQRNTAGIPGGTRLRAHCKAPLLPRAC